MHLEQNVSEILINTCMNITKKTKYNPKSRKELALTCSRPTLELGESEKKPHAPYSLKPKKKKEVIRWLINFKFSDGYVVGFRRSLNVKIMKPKLG
jgi:hypothetical protein